MAAGSRFFTKSPSAANILPSSSFSGQISSGDQVRASVAHLLAHADTLPCSTAAQAFFQLVQPTARFQLALDALLPLLNPSVEFAQRILVSFILYSMYSSHPISLNPFKSALYATFVSERVQAIKIAAGGGFSENEQLVWVLWKILKGDGNDIGPYSPSTLTRSPLLPELRASNLFLDEDNFIDMDQSGSAISELGRHRIRGVQHDDNEGMSADGRSTTIPERHITPEEDEQNAYIAHGMKLLLAARDRTLTLAEQRILVPLIPSLTTPPMVTSMDLPPIVGHNPTIAYHLILASLTSGPKNTQSQGSYVFLDALKALPPTLPSFDLLGRLLQNTCIVVDAATGGKTTIADVIRAEVLGHFINENIKWIDAAEGEERDGQVSDDRFAKGVQNLCRFYSSLIRLSIVDPASDAESAEMAHFTLRNSRFEEANILYRVLASGRF